MMWKYIGLWTLAAAVVCGLAAALLRMQRIGAKPNIINVFAGLALNNGFRLTRRWHLNGDQQLLTATIAAWLAWTLLGAAVIALVTPGYNPGGMYLVYGALCGVVGAILGFILTAIAAGLYAKAINMSSFEGKAGYFVMFMGLLGGIVGALAAGIAMAIFFYHQGH